jgi:hypothetical protein
MKPSSDGPRLNAQGASPRACKPQPKKFKQTAIILISRDYSRKILLKDPDPTNGGEQDELLTRGR